jgi:tetratricopeptide (TPR) repeat protein
MDTKNPHDLTADEFDNLYEHALEVVEGPTPERAVQLLEDLIVRASDDRDVDDPVAIDLRMYLGRALWRSGVLAKAIAVLRSALADAERVTGPDTRLSFSCAGNLCRALADNDEFEEAIEIAFDTFERRREVFGELDNGTLNSLGHISQICFRAGLFEQAVDTTAEQLERRIEAFGKNDARTRISRYNLEVMTSMLALDEEFLRAKLDTYEESHGPGSEPCIQLRCHIAAGLEREGRLEEALAERTVIEGLAVEVHGEVAIPTLQATARRLRLALRLGDRRAADMLAVVASTVSRIAGPDHPLVGYCNCTDA